MTGYEKDVVFKWLMDWSQRYGYNKNRFHNNRIMA